MKIAAVVVLYNPDESIIRNIRTYSEQIDLLYAIDNSEVESASFREKLSGIGNVKYVSCKDNYGISYALNKGAELAIYDGFEYLLTMDQDSSAPDDLVKKLSRAAEEFPDAAILSPLHGNRYSTVRPADELYEEILVTKTSGNLLNLKLFSEIGKFNEEFFIDYVDIEYCMRIHQANKKVILVNNVLLIHNEADLTKRKFFFSEVYPYNHSPVRFYYKTRNRFYLRDKFKKAFPEYFSLEFRLFVNNFVKVILYEKDKLLKFRMSLRGYSDYLKGITGKLKP